MTTNSIAASASSTVQTIINHIPSLPDLSSFGFTPTSLLPYACLWVFGSIVYKAIEEHYTIAARIEHEGDQIQLNLQPRGSEA